MNDSEKPQGSRPYVPPERHNTQYLFGENLNSNEPVSPETHTPTHLPYNPTQPPVNNQPAPYQPQQGYSHQNYGQQQFPQQGYQQQNYNQQGFPQQQFQQNYNQQGFPQQQFQQNNPYPGQQMQGAIPPKAGRSTLPIIALVLGIVAFLLSRVPAIGFIVAIAAFTFGLISLLRLKGQKGMAWAGVILATFAFLLSFGMVVSVPKDALDTLNDNPTQIDSPPFWDEVVIIGVVGDTISHNFEKAEVAYTLHSATYTPDTAGAGLGTLTLEVTVEVIEGEYELYHENMQLIDAKVNTGIYDPETSTGITADPLMVTGEQRELELSYVVGEDDMYNWTIMDESLDDAIEFIVVPLV